MNRLRSVLVMLSCAWMVSVVQAQNPPPTGGQPPEGGPGGRGPGGFGFQLPSFPLLEALDDDKDGKLSKEEVENAVTALKKLDKDGDGKLSQEEIGWPPAFMGRGGPGGPGMGFGVPGFGVGPGGGPGGNIVERIMSNDKDGDGKVTQAELPETMQRIMLRADTNQDGSIDESEAEAMAATMGRRGGPGGGPGFGPGSGPGGNIVERIMSNDKDADGKVTQAELPEAMQRIMQRADTNKDGAIDQSEAEALAKEMNQRGGFGRGPGPGGAPPEQPKRPNRDRE